MPGNELPATFYFKTGKLNLGVLQIVGFIDKKKPDEPRGIKIRYKKLLLSAANPSAGEKTGGQAAPANRQTASAHYNLGIILAGRGQFDEAIAQYRKALEIKPDYAEAHNNLGIILVGLGQNCDAIAHYREAVEVKPDFLEAQINLGNALAGIGRINSAREHYQKALDLASAADDAVTAGLVRARINDLEPPAPPVITPQGPDNRVAPPAGATPVEGSGKTSPLPQAGAADSANQSPTAARIATQQRLRQRLALEHRGKQKVWTWQRLKQEIEHHLEAAGKRFKEVSVDVSDDASTATVAIKGLQEKRATGGKTDWVDIDGSVAVRKLGGDNWEVLGNSGLQWVPFTVKIPDLIGADAAGPVKGFGPVVERILTEDDADRDGMVFFRMDTGVSFPPDTVPLVRRPGSMPFVQITPELKAWIKTTGADLLIRLTDKDFEWMYLDMPVAFAGTSQDWGKITPQQLTALFAGKDAKEFTRSGVSVGGYQTSLPDCMAFRTRGNLIGVYQIEGIPDVAEHPGVIIRYKLVQSTSSTGQAVSAPQPKPAAETRK